MVPRPFWIDRINQAWETRSIVWLSGVRRVGKTTIAKMLPGIEYLNCDLPSTQRRIEDPESFFYGLKNVRYLVLDEVHQLENPSSVLKIAADEFPELKILATGSSTLEATKKFRDALTGRKHVIYLPPVLWNECRQQFDIHNLDHRLFFGGLPEPLLSRSGDLSFFSEWFDCYYARDIQELFNVRNRSGFLKLMHLLFRSSGNLIDYTNLSKLSGLSRPTVLSYLEALRIANVVFPLTPYHGGGRRELTQQPKYYCFDTGFIRFVKGWNELREEDRGFLWEHLVLDMLRASIPYPQIFYWRDKSNREIDFIIKRSGEAVDLIECKINPDHFSGYAVKVFRESYPLGNNYCISPYITKSYSSKRDDLLITFIGDLEEYSAILI
ncbi:MAG TPA: ATP-binding protein [Bacteroidales bacterium]|nr:ATP-binding protein [Bacteroidales bacterium]HNS45736.1 ATP-binding protein [Bacteroidales bacterium]